MESPSNSSEHIPLNHTGNSKSPKPTPGDSQIFSRSTLENIRGKHKLPRKTPDIVLKALAIFRESHVSYIGRKSDV